MLQCPSCEVKLPKAQQVLVHFFIEHMPKAYRLVIDLKRAEKKWSVEGACDVKTCVCGIAMSFDYFKHQHVKKSVKRLVVHLHEVAHGTYSRED
jgi:hypothetical protein